MATRARDPGERAIFGGLAGEKAHLKLPQEKRAWSARCQPQAQVPCSLVQGRSLVLPSAQ